MNRRRLLQVLATCGASPVLLHSRLIIADSTTQLKPAQRFFSEHERLLVAALAETIIPTTDTPGAKVAGVHHFIEVMVGQTFFESDQASFRGGLNAVEVLSKQRYDSGYTALVASRQIDLLKSLATGQAATEQSDAAAMRDFFQLLKELTVIGYYTSEIGASKELVYLPLPGRYDGCTDMADDQAAWSFGSRGDF